MKSIATMKISLAAAQRVTLAGVEAASHMGVPMAVVVLDCAGQLVSAVRMDGATLLAYEVALRKAWTSAMAGAPTAGVHQFVSSDAGALLSMPHVPNFTTVGGGIPLMDQGVCIGAVGISGATVELDSKVAAAAAAALTE
jgi:uncharacterized protein GlcG (DUF336 family)